MTMLARRDFEKVELGEALPRHEIRVTLPVLVRYAAATWDFHHLHYDTAAAEAAGMRAPVMDGQMTGALFGRQLMRWGGEGAFLRRLSYRQIVVVELGDHIVVHGAVTGKTTEHGRNFVTFRLGVTDVAGTSDIVRDATATIELPPAEGHGRARVGPPR